MTWLGALLIAALAAIVNGLLLIRSAAHGPADDFGAGIFAWLIIALGGIVLVVWLFAALWLHRWL